MRIYIYIYICRTSSAVGSSGGAAEAFPPTGSMYVCMYVCNNNNNNNNNNDVI